MASRIERAARRVGLVAACLLTASAAAWEITPADAARYSIGRTYLPPPALTFTLIDAEVSAASSGASAGTWLRDTTIPPTRRAPAEDDDIAWRLGYRRSRLTDAVSNTTLRTDPSTGFSRQLDRDVLDLGLSWRLPGGSLGLGYQLQAARKDGDFAAAGGLSRLLPGSEQATHAFTLGVRREFGAGAPPPVAAPPVPRLEYAPVPAAPPRDD